MYENLRELSNKLTKRVYLLNTGEIVIAEDEEAPTGVVAYTWYRTRSKNTNKWTIQLVENNNGN